MQEIGFNTSLIREMRMIASYNKLIEQGRMRGGKVMLVHVIEAEKLIRAFSWTSRLNADWAFLQHLHNMGRARADQWLGANFDRVSIEIYGGSRDKIFLIVRPTRAAFCACCPKNHAGFAARSSLPTIEIPANCCAARSQSKVGADWRLLYGLRSLLRRITARERAAAAA
jgi:hypothetical protein